VIREYHGQLAGNGRRFGIVVARFNELITRRLLEGAVDTLTRHGVRPEDIEVVWVPGSFELPVAAQALAETGRFSAVICLGAVIRGATPHFEYVASQAAAGIGRVALDSRLPVVFGVITAETQEQALERAGGKVGNRGAEAALAALEMADLLSQVRSLSPAGGETAG
jgi:6,7-dimethyl-8-ribityllumazine synthase